MWDKLPPEMLHEMRFCIQELADDEGKFREGSLFSGTGIQSVSFKNGVQEPGNDKFGLNLEVVHQYCVEPGDVQTAFLQESFLEMKHLFETCAKLVHSNVFCANQKKMVVVPVVHWLARGASFANRFRQITRTLSRTKAAFEGGRENRRKLS